MTQQRQIQAPIGPHTIQRFTFSNGITLLVQENHVSPSVVVRGQLWAGAIDDSLEQLGLAQFTATSLTRGTETRTYGQLNELLESVGADLYVSSGQHLTSFGGKSLAEDFDLLAELLADVLLKPAFSQTELEKIRTQVTTALHELENSTRGQASRLFKKLLFTPAHPYSHPINGTLETVPTITRENMQHFYEKHYAPEGTIIVVVGDVQALSIRDLLENQLQTWQRQRPDPITPIPEVDTVTERRQEVLTMPGKSQSDLILGFVGLDRRSPHFYAANVGNVILGRLGLGGRLGDTVRETHGLAYYVNANLSAGLGRGPWSISAGVNGSNVEKVVDLILSALRRFIQEPIPEQELNDAKSYITGVLPLQLASNEGIAGTLLYIERHQLGDDYIIRYPDLINAVTADEILATAQAYIIPENITLAVAGDYKPTQS